MQDPRFPLTSWFEELSVPADAAKGPSETECDAEAENAIEPSASQSGSPESSFSASESGKSGGAPGLSSPEVPAAGRDWSEGSQSLLMTIAREAMACEFEVLLNQHQYPNAPDHAVDALDLIEHYESELSVYRPRSDLSILNRFGGEKSVSVSGETVCLLQLAQAIHEQTARAFDITAGSLSEVWGFSRRAARRPSDDEIADALQKVGSDLLEVDSDLTTAGFRRPGVTVNPGGIGKGFALDRAAQGLARKGTLDFMMHGGLSSVIAHGDRMHPETGGGWLVALKHPWRWEQPLGMIRLRNQALATSGSGKQFFHFDGKRYSHIIDPRTGWPAQQMMSATVICRSAAIADALATAFFVMGERAATEFCDRNPEIAAVLVYQDEKTGKQKLKTINLAEDQWIADRRGGS